MKTELADARRALDRKDAELAQLREDHATRLREAEEQLATAAKTCATAKADAIYARAEAQAAQQRPSPGALQRAESPVRGNCSGTSSVPNPIGPRSAIGCATRGMRSGIATRSLNRGLMKATKPKPSLLSTRSAARTRRVPSSRTARRSLQRRGRRSIVCRRRRARALRKTSSMPRLSRTYPGNWSWRVKSSERQRGERTWPPRAPTSQRRRRRSRRPWTISTRRCENTNDGGKRSARGNAATEQKNCGRHTATSGAVRRREANIGNVVASRRRSRSRPTRR